MQTIVGIYKIINIVNNKAYIGSSKDIKNRIRTHYRELQNNKHRNSHLQASYNKYGRNNFKHIVLEECSIDLLFEREQYYIDLLPFDMLYNSVQIAGGGGSELQRIPVYLLNFKGDILKTFTSLLDARIFLNRTRLEIKDCNNGRILKGVDRNYRCVTCDFYNTKKEVIDTWPPYSSYTVYKYNFITTYLILSNGQCIKEFKTMRQCGKYIGISNERVRQILRDKDGYHKFTGFTVKVKVTDINKY